MCNSIRLFFSLCIRRYCWYIIFSALISINAYSKSLIFSLSDEEKQQLKQEKIDYYNNLSSTTSYSLRSTSADADPLTNQTFLQWQNNWLDVWYETFWYSDSFLQISAYNAEYLTTLFNSPELYEYSFPYLSLQNQQFLLQTNSVFAVTTSNQLDKVISKLDKIASYDANGNANINVNFQPIQQILDDIKNVTQDQLNQIISQLDNLVDVSNSNTNLNVNFQPVITSITAFKNDTLSKLDAQISVLNEIKNDHSVIPEIIALKTDILKKLDDQISILSSIIGVGGDGGGNPNINVNLDPLLQPLQDLKNQLLASNDHLDRISQAVKPEITDSVSRIADIAEKIELNQVNIEKELTDGFEEANTTLDHIDSDLHNISESVQDILIEFGDGASISGDTIQDISKAIANQLNVEMSPLLEAETQKVVDSLDEKFEIASSDMSQVGVAESAGTYLNSAMNSAKNQLQSELQNLQYTNINAVVYDYEEYNNYYDLQTSTDNPTSNDVFIREKVQEYIDAVNYATENVKGQIISRIDELKQSTLLTTDYNPKWLVVKQGALYSKNGHQFPDEDWEVDFSKIKLDSGIAKSIYDWIYYIMSCVIIYKQFRKVAD